MIRRLLLACIFCTFFPVHTQQKYTLTTWNLSGNEEPQEITALFTGLIQHSVFFDSNQVIGTSHDLTMYFPERPNYDVQGKNIRNKSQCNMSALETAFGIEIHMPKVLGAQPTGYLECNAEGYQLAFQRTPLINRFQFTQAYFSLAWDNDLTISLGQIMHPMHLAHISCVPRVIADNHGAPIAVPETYQPQLRIHKQWDHANILCAALSQLSNVIDGPIGFSSTYLRNSLTPMLHGQFYAAYETFKGGFGIDYQRIMPRIKSNTNYKVHERLNSISTYCFAKCIIDPLIMRTATIYSENGNDDSMISGYGVSSICPVTDERHYANTRSISSWIDISLRKTIEPGIFFGITKNIGSSEQVIQSITNNSTGKTERTLYGFVPDIDKIVRVAPRVYWHIESLSFGAEFEYTRAWYGTPNNHGKVINTQPVGNFRLQLGSFYYF